MNLVHLLLLKLVQNGQSNIYIWMPLICMAKSQGGRLRRWSLMSLLILRWLHYSFFYWGNIYKNPNQTAVVLVISILKLKYTVIQTKLCSVQYIFSYTSDIVLKGCQCWLVGPLWCRLNYQPLLDGLPWNLVQRFMSPWWLWWSLNPLKFVHYLLHGLCPNTCKTILIILCCTF